MIRYLNPNIGKYTAINYTLIATQNRAYKKNAQGTYRILRALLNLSYIRL